MSSLLYAAGFGILGALLRVGVDYLKCLSLNKTKIEKSGFLTYAVPVVIIGAFLGIVLDYGWPVSLLGGYAGQDVLDGLYKAAKKITIQFK